ncbi:MAG: GrpB family protein [Nostoc sp.]
MRELNLLPEQIIIFDYDTHWAILFGKLRVTVAEVLGDLALAIEHVGSTSVPGLPAKPIIDMDVVVETSAQIPKVSERLATLGYVYEGDKGIKGREAFVCPPNKARHHLYVCPRDSEALKFHLLFRDYLLKHSNEAQRYGCLKRELALKFTNDIEAYTNGKTAYIQMIIERALKDGY